MKILKSKYEILTPLYGSDILQSIEVAGRTCYKSEKQITTDSASKFVSTIVKRGHLSVIEHVSITVRFTCDRGISHETVRHRLSSFSQESTRYCNYSGGGIQVIDIEHHFKNPKSIDIWLNAMMQDEINYNTLISFGESPQIARSVLANSLKTEIVITSNLRQWRTIFLQRTAKAAHPQMRELIIPLCKEFQEELPEIYGDIKL